MSCTDDTAGAPTLPRHTPAMSIEVLRNQVHPATGANASAQLMLELQSSYPVLLRWMRSKLGDRDLAAELVNDAVVITLDHHRSGRLHHGDNIAGYVFKIGMNLLRNHRRKLENQPRLHLPIDAAEQASQELPADARHDARLGEAVLGLLESLGSRRDREIVKQFYLDGTDKDSLCQRFAVSSLQFNVIVSRARQRMKAVLETRGFKKIDLLSLLWCGLSAALLAVLAAAGLDV